MTKLDAKLLVGPRGPDLVASTARLTLVHAFDPSMHGSAAPPELLLEMRPRITAAAGGALEQMIANHEASGVAMRGLVLEGDPEEKILAAAKDVHAQLIVVGSHHRRGIGRLLLGSVSEDVMRAAGGRIVLMDFGAGHTPIYLAPEVLAGGQATAATDLYAPGVLLYFLVTARFPVRGTTVEELRARHARGERRRLAKANRILNELQFSYLVPNPDRDYPP